MGIFDGQTAILFRNDASGQRVYAPFGPWGGVYRVSDGDASRIQRQVKTFWFVALITTVAGQISLGLAYAVLALPVLLIAYFGLAWLHVRNLPRLPVNARELPSISRAELQRQYSGAIGVPILAFLTFSSFVFTILGVWLLTRGAGVQGWFIVAFFGFCTVSLFRQLQRARQ